MSSWALSDCVSTVGHRLTAGFYRLKTWPVYQTLVISTSSFLEITKFAAISYIYTQLLTSFTCEIVFFSSIISLFD